MKQRLGLFLCLILALAGCSGPPPEAVIEHEAITSANTTALLADLPPAVPDLSSFPVTIENCGRTLTFTQPPERVVGLWQPVNETLQALGVQDRIIGFAGMYDSLPAEFDEAAQDMDGRRLAVVLTKDGGSQLYSVNADGSGVTRLASSSGIDTERACSPDGQYIYFTSDRGAARRFIACPAPAAMPSVSATKAVSTSPRGFPPTARPWPT